MSVQIGVRGGDSTLSDNILNFTKGRATTILRTGTKTGTASLYVQNSGLGKIVGESFTILPGSPANITLSSPEILYARAGARDMLTVRLYDLYGNLTTLHGNTLRLSVDKNIIEPLAIPRNVATGIFETDIVSLGYPGRLLFRVWLEKDGKKSSLISLENVSQTNALPVITSEEASQNSWQNLTQVLLGAAFGQTPVQGYFG